MNLFDLTAEYKAILEMAEDADVDPEILKFHLEDIGGAIEEKADSIAFVLTQLDGDVELLKKESDRLLNRIKTVQGNANWLKKYLETAMKETGKTKFKTAFHNFCIQKNTPAVILLDGAKIPEHFLIPQPPKVDKRAILAELKTGAKLDFAELMQTEGLRIR